MKLPALLRRRPFWLFSAALLLLILALPALLGAWLPIALAPFGFREVDARLSLPGFRRWEAEHLAFAWDGPDGLRLSVAGDKARYDYGADALRLERAELSLQAWPVRPEAGPETPPLSEWPLLPLRRLDVEHLRLSFPIGGLSKQAEGRLKAELTPDGGASLVLYMAQGLPDELPGRFELAIAPDAKLKATAGLSRGKTTVFFTELHLDAPPAHAPAYRLRSAGDLRPFYRWLALGVPEEAQVRLNLHGQLPRRLNTEGWLADSEAHAEFTVQARHWALPWGLAERLTHTGRLDLAKGQGRLELQGDALDAAGYSLPPFRLDSRFQRQVQAVKAQGRLQSPALDSRFALSYKLDKRTGELRLDDVKSTLDHAWPLLRPYLPAGLKPMTLESGQLQGTLLLPWQAGLHPVRLKGKLELLDLAGRYQGMSWRGANASLELASLDPLAARGDWRVGSLALPADFSLESLQGRFEASGTSVKPVVKLSEIAAQALGGQLRIPELDWQAGTPLAFVLEAERLDLAALLALAEQPGLGGEGRVSGRLPIIWQDGQPSLGTGAQLRAEGAGALRYNPGPAPKDENIGLQALRDFRYKRLDVAPSYGPNGDYALKLQLEGANPALYNGYPIAFNLNLEGHLPDLLRAALLSGDFAGHVMKSLKPEADQEENRP
ncbi:MAG: YdbH domain-containing protein [Gammaproteobacteria bacterium]|nr:YdbH domain-containing protein [Gammaproteobacteria bacterium]